MTDSIDLDIESLDARAQGVAQRDGKRFFIDGALPGERVRVAIQRDKTSHAFGRVGRVLRPSPWRVAPRCPHFGVCGGCGLQHVDGPAQVAYKQRQLEEAFQRAAGLRPQRMLPPLHGPQWEYRYRARLAVRFVPARGGVLLGFHERKSSYVADIRVCHVLPKAVSDLLEPLHDLIASLSIPHRVPQIEVAVGEASGGTDLSGLDATKRGDGFMGGPHSEANKKIDGNRNVVVLVLRHLLPLADTDLRRLRAFALRHGIAWWLQPGGPASAAPLDAVDDSDEAGTPAYGLPRYGLAMRFRPTDFIQANVSANRALVSLALDLLQARPGHRVLDLFCGLGNFTLPLAAQACEVVGVEGSEALLMRARQGADRHGLAARTRFACADLFHVDADWLRGLGGFDAILLDPPREGARAVAQALAALEHGQRPRRVVYVSCNPSTLARDVAILAHKGGYTLKASGVVNMFPHTAHVESVSVLE